MTIEPVTEQQVDALIRAVGPLPAMIAGLDDVDIRRGRGVLEGQSRCIWTTSGHRITISLVDGGGVIVSKSQTPDPEAPDA